MSLRSPLGKVLGFGSAKEGTDHFWVQRLTAVALVLLGLWFAIALAKFDGYTQGEVLAFIGAPLHCILLLLLIVTLAWHSSLGVQVVVEDYVHGPFIKVFTLIVCKFAHIAVAAAAVFAVLKIAFGAPA